MMDCTHYRQILMVDPHDPDPALGEHGATCHDCNLYTQRLLRFESRLERALGVPVPAQADSPTAARAELGTDAPESGLVIPFRRKSLRAAADSAPYRKGWLAMAASVLLALVVAGGLWLSAPGPSLAAAVVTHMAGEPQAWRRTDVPVPTPALLDVLRNSSLSLGAGAGVVSYAASCEFRGHRVPHLVVQTESGPVTVMVLVHEHVPKTVQFDEQGYRGVIVPVAGHGSLAVLTRGASTDIGTVQHIASRVLESIDWTG
jgi:uncharacterized protein DUF3379